MDNSGFNFELVKVFLVADDMAKRRDLKFITRIIFLAALLYSEDCSMYQWLISRDISREKIAYATKEMFNKYRGSIKEETDGMLLEFNLINTSVRVSEELNEMIQEAFYLAETYYDKETIDCNDMLSAVNEYLTEEFDYFLDCCGVETILQDKDNDKEVGSMEIPHDIANCLTILNYEPLANTEECVILGRDKETLQLMRILAKDTKRNAVLVGEPGVGKTALVHKLAWMITSGNCPEKFKDCMVIVLDVNSIIAGTTFRGQAEERFELLIRFLEQNENVILFIDEIHTLLGAGACRDGDLDLANALKPILARSSTQVIGATTMDEYQRYFSRDGALKRRFEKIVIKEPKIDEVYPMIKNQIARLTKSHDVTISRELIDKTIFYASCFNYETKNPDRSLDLVDRAMAVTELAGRKEVTIEDILTNFDVNTKIFEKTPIEIKTGLAYHEAGHYILHHFSKELSDHHILAVSIMPADDYYGVNVFEIDSDIIPSHTRDYYIELIACKLAGRVAEKMYSNKLSAGASNDLSHATRIAKDMITRYGLDEDFTESRVYLRESENPMYNDAVIDRINTRVDAIVEEAKKYAERVLKSHRKYLEILVKALLEKGMLSEAEIETLFADNIKDILPKIADNN